MKGRARCVHWCVRFQDIRWRSSYLWGRDKRSIEFKLSSIKIIVFNHSSCLPEYGFPHSYRVRNNSCGALDEEKCKFIIATETHLAWNECTIAYSIERRSFDDSVECVIFILPLVELQMTLECSTSIFLRTFNHGLLTRSSKLKSFFIRYNFSYYLFKFKLYFSCVFHFHIIVVPHEWNIR